MAVAIICECNPFHNGHKYIFNSAKNKTKEPLIAIMSGSFTQRGEVAVTDKFIRAKAMLQNGADLVVELPVAYAVANAEAFARGAVSIAKSFDEVNFLAFGCESSDINILIKALNATQNPLVLQELKKLMKNGDYYPRALQNSVETVYGKQVSDIVASPNNILAVEYLKALGSSKIKAVPVKRIGAEHNSSKPYGEFASASFIRQLMRRGEDVSKFMPCSEEYSEITKPENLERITLYKLRTMTKEGFAKLPDVSEGLENRIYSAVRSNNCVEDIISAVKTKRYTYSRISRIVASALLGLTKSDSLTPIEYVRVLGFTRVGASLLKSCKLKIVTSPADGLHLGGNIEKLLKKDILATDISCLAYDKVQKAGSDFCTPVIKV